MGIVHGTLGFVFPGQGSQSVGMLRDLAAHHAEIQQVFAEASEVLGFDLWELVCDGPEEDLNRTENTQPAMLAADVAVWRVWTVCSEIRPAWMAGHSLGEYSALVCANAISFEDAVRLVRARGRLMQNAVPPGDGAMAAILGLEDERLVQLCKSTSMPGGVVSAANFNAPGQVVIAGHSAAVRRVVDRAKSEGAKRSVVLPVSVPSHCSLMTDAAESLNPILANTPCYPPQTPVLHNVDVAVHESPDEIRSALVAQMYRSVRWSETVKSMCAKGVNRFVECGPGKVLSGLSKRIAPDCSVYSTGDEESLTKAKESVQ